MAIDDILPEVFHLPAYLRYMYLMTWPIFLPYVSTASIASAPPQDRQLEPPTSEPTER